MAQPPAYNPTTDFSEEEADSVAGRSTVRTAMLDAELANIATTIAAIRANLALIQRDDTALKDLVVTLASLSVEVQEYLIAAGGTPRGTWVTATAYAVKDVVKQGTGTYICVTAHTSGVFATDLAADKWTVIFDTALYTGANVSFTPTGTIAAANVQAAIAEAAAEALQISQNLADLANAATARSNLGVAIANKGGILAGTGGNAIAEKAVGTDGSALVLDSTQSDGLLWVLQYPKSLAPNPFFQVAQVPARGTAADDAYGGCDRWYALTQSASITIGQQTLQENGQATNLRLTQTNAVAQRMGTATIIEAKDSQPLRGKQITFRPRVRISNSQAVRIAVLEWTGTADVPTSDVVNNWASGTYTAGNFFLAANLTVTGVGSKTPSAATWTDMDALTVTIGNSCNNLIVMVWTEGSAAQNVTLDVGKVRLLPGAYAGEIAIPTFEEVLRACRRHLPVFQSDSDGAQIFAVGQCISTTQAIVQRALDTPLFREATGLTWEGLTSELQLRHAGSTTNLSVALAVSTVNNHSADFLATVAAGLTAGNGALLKAASVAGERLYLTGAEL